MKKKRDIIYISSIIILLFIVSCKKAPEVFDPENPVVTNVGLDAVTVPNGFEFKTTNDFQIQLEIKGDGSAKFERSKFYIYSGDPDNTGVLLSSGGINQNNIYQTMISLPKVQDSIYVSSNITGLSLGMVSIQSNTFSHQFDFSNTPKIRSSLKADFTDIISDFEDGIDGWTPYRDESINTSDASNTPITRGPLGSSDKFIWGFDTRGGIRSFLAPSKFSGNIYGQYFAYHYYLGNTVKARPVQANISDIRITDGTNVLAIDLSSTFQHEVNAGWQTIYAKLDETETAGSGWRIGGMSYWTTGNGNRTLPNEVATPDEIQQVLQNVTEVLIAPEYQVGYYSANGPEFICLGKVGVVNDISTFPIIQQGEIPDDADNDGIPDNTDDYPNDPLKAYNNYSPGEGIYGTLAYEDLWPQKGDYDFNDLVIDYNYNIITNANNRVVEMDADFLVKASGGSYLNSFAFELAVSQSTVTNVIGQQLSGNTFSLNSNKTEANQTNAVIALFDDANTLFNTEGIVNTNPSAPFHSPVSIDIQVLFDGSFEISDLGTAPYNPFILANQRRDYEIHLAGYRNTPLANTTIFGTHDDDSNIAQEKYYQTSNNLPWAIHLPVSFDYPTETTSIENAYLKFVDWAESGGTAFPNWYLSINGYRNNTYIYQTPD